MYAFVVSLDQFYVEVVGQYEYTVQCSAVGGAKLDAPGMMEVLTPKVDCTGSYVGIQRSEFSYAIPREGVDITTPLFESSSLYVEPS
jgi:hypothetical protein